MTGLPGSRDLGSRLSDNPLIRNTSPGIREETFFSQISSLSQHSRQNGTIFAMYLHFRSVRIRSVKVTRVTKAAMVANDVSPFSMFHHFGEG